MKAVVVSFDRLSLGFLGCYGNLWVETPNFDRLACRSVVFDGHFSENVADDAGHHAWWTGCYQFQRTHRQQAKLPTFFDVLTSAGVDVQMLVEDAGDDAPAVPRPDFTNSDDVVGEDGLDVDEAQTPFARLVEGASQFLDEAGNRAGENASSLLWLKSRGVPSPWLPPRAFATRYLDLIDETPREADVQDDVDQESVEQDGEEESFLEFSDDEFDSVLEAVASLGENAADGDAEAPGDLECQMARSVYAGYVSLLDRSLGRLLAAIDGHSAGDEVMLIVTAAEGHPLNFDDTVPAHRTRLSEAVVHTPLLVRVPGVEMGTRRQCLVQTVDLVPTLLDWFALETPSLSCEGQSLLPAVRDEERETREYVCLGKSRRACGIRTRDYYLVRSDSPNASGDSSQPALFSKPEDVWDVSDLARQSPEVVKRLSAMLNRFLSEPGA